MKKEINFDHEASSLVRALNVDPHSFANQLAAVMAIYESSDEEKLSRLSQLIHTCVDYKIVLLNMIAQHRDSGSIDDLLGNLSNN